MKSKLEYEGPEQLRANQLFRAKLFVTPAQTIQTGGRIVVAARHFSDIGDPQTDDPESENYITIDSDASASFKVNTENPGWGRHPWNRGIDLILDEGTIPAGTEILIHLGNPSHGSPGYRCQSFTETNFRFRLGIDPAGNDDWEVLPSKQCPGCMPIFEIHSCHRNYEHRAQEAIRRGLRFGFIGGSDDHRGAIGDSHTTARDRFFSSHSGLVGVYAKELTRESLWKAFFSRRVYATNGPRIILDVRLNGALTGEEISVEPGETLRMEIHAVLDGLLDRIEVFRNTSPVHLLAGGDQANQIDVFRGAYEEAAPAGNTAYYVRVRQTDGGTAWSSPVWVDAI
ncbi:MAG: DUF3604 domain-containing protein [Candidatus Brocadiia bacterium]